MSVLEIRTCQHYAYLAVGVLKLVAIFLSAVIAIGYAVMTAVLLQGILLLSDTSFLLLNLLDIGMGEILLQSENFCLEWLYLLSRQSATRLLRPISWKEHCDDARVPARQRRS